MASTQLGIEHHGIPSGESLRLEGCQFARVLRDVRGRLADQFQVTKRGIVI